MQLIFNLYFNLVSGPNPTGIRTWRRRRGYLTNRDRVQGVPRKDTIKKIARKGGCKRISHQFYDITQDATKTFLV